MKLEYVGNCVNCFDNDGVCIIPQLPFENVSDFAHSLEDAEDISEKNFLQKVSFEQATNLGLQLGKGFEFYKTDTNVFIMYSNAEDIHYFFV